MYTHHERDDVLGANDEITLCYTSILMCMLWICAPAYIEFNA